jgi:hypothetical protein
MIISFVSAYRLTLFPRPLRDRFGYVDEAGKLNHPRGIAVHRPTGFVVVSDENDHLQVEP